MLNFFVAQVSLPTVKVLGYDVASITLQQACEWALGATQTAEPNLLVTLNPEIIMAAQTDLTLQAALHAAQLTVADGVGVVWAAKQVGHTLPERIPGVELVETLLAKSGDSLRVYFLGAKPGVAEKAADNVHERYGTVIAGTQHGYFKRPDDVPDVIGEISRSGANLLLAGLGEGQEAFLHSNRALLNIPLMIGVGGTLDVLSGEVTRTPLWTRQLRLEWAYRIASDRSRWHRFPRLIKFARYVRSTK